MASPDRLEQPPSIHRVAVVGAGLLGIRIAGELALQGCTVHVYDKDPIVLQTIHSTIATQLEELKDQGLLPPDHQMKGVVVADSILSSAVSEADIVFEAIVEDACIKNLLFKDIASVCSSDTILCSSTLNLHMEDIFESVFDKERTLGVRFLFPVYLIDAVEVTPYTLLSKQTLIQVQRFLGELDKKPFQRSPDEGPKILSEDEVVSLRQGRSRTTDLAS